MDILYSSLFAFLYRHFISMQKRSSFAHGSNEGKTKQQTTLHRFLNTETVSSSKSYVSTINSTTSTASIHSVSVESIASTVVCNPVEISNNSSTNTDSDLDTMSTSDVAVYDIGILYENDELQRNRRSEVSDMKILIGRFIRKHRRRFT